ncbi:hypothetical protein ACFWJS_34255 [Streptomyces sp. NPDC127061]|uniref:hypothetical protein n=1 Tax=Streptomyces sp. NPDC127061 TaxID=3347122 RepID=UPI00365BA63D
MDESDHADDMGVELVDKCAYLALASRGIVYRLKVSGSTAEVVDCTPLPGTYPQYKIEAVECLPGSSDALLGTDDENLAGYVRTARTAEPDPGTGTVWCDVGLQDPYGSWGPVLSYGTAADRRLLSAQRPARAHEHAVGARGEKGSGQRAAALGPPPVQRPTGHKSPLPAPYRDARIPGIGDSRLLFELTRPACGLVSSRWGSCARR